MQNLFPKSEPVSQSSIEEEYPDKRNQQSLQI